MVERPCDYPWSSERFFRRGGGPAWLDIDEALPSFGPTRRSSMAVGDKAPDFTLPATTQEKWSLSELIGKKNIVLFSFIGAFTPT